MARRKKSASRAHARHTTALATRPSVVVVRSGGSGGGRRRRRSGGGTVVRYARARRVGRAAGGHALHVTGLATGGALLGYLQGAGHLEWVPEVMGSKLIGAALVGYAATRVVKNKYVREAAGAAVAVAGFEFGREHGAGSGGSKHASTRGWGGIGSGGGGVGPFGGA